jgi:ABC transport system ATP-binding/permease protein
VLKLIIEDDEGRKTVVPFVREEITIGRQEGNTIRLTERNVSRRHARLIRNNGSIVVEDLGSSNGIRINGERITGRSPVRDGDLIQIGDYDLALQQEVQVQLRPPPPPAETTQTHIVMPNGHPHEPSTEQAMEVLEAEPISAETAVEATVPDPSARLATSVIRVDQVEANRTRPVVDIDLEEAPRLVVVNTEFAGREFACIRSELKVGRTDENDITLEHRSLSRTHAKIVREANGEWRVLDLQSANGIAVNGEQYAAASLKPGDVLELGHVKLKFLGPGEAYRPARDVEAHTEPPSRSRSPFVLPLVLVLAGGLGAGLYFQWPSLAALMEGRPAAAPEVTPPLPKPIAQPTPSPKPTPSPAAAAPTPAPEEIAAAELAAQAAEGIAQANADLAAQQVESAIRRLEQVRKLAELPPTIKAKAEDLLDRAKAELLFKGRLDAAERALAKGRSKEARRLLEEASATQVFAERHQALSARLSNGDTHPAGQAIKVPEPPKPDEVVFAPPEPSTTSPLDDAKRLAQDGIALLKKRQFREARTVFTRCLEIHPTFSTCHLMLGSTYAQLKKPDAGARHYRTFLELAPDAPEAPSVRALLEDYEARQGGNE